MPESVYHPKTCLPKKLDRIGWQMLIKVNHLWKIRLIRRLIQRPIQRPAVTIYETMTWSELLPLCVSSKDIFLRSRIGRDLQWCAIVSSRHYLLNVYWIDEEAWNFLVILLTDSMRLSITGYYSVDRELSACLLIELFCTLAVCFELPIMKS